MTKDSDSGNVSLLASGRRKLIVGKYIKKVFEFMAFAEAGASVLRLTRIVPRFPSTEGFRIHHPTPASWPSSSVGYSIIQMIC